MSMSKNVCFRVGNTYSCLPSGRARLDRTHKHLKIHDWVLYVDILQGSDHDHVDFVKFDMNHASFEPHQFTSSCPIPVETKNGGSTVWRFSTRQQTYGPVGPISVIVRGRGGTNKVVQYDLVLSENGGADNEIHVLEAGGKLRPFKAPPLWNRNFGVELELTASSREVDFNDVARVISTKARESVQVCNYSQGRETSGSWKLVPDNSIVCSRTEPDCTRFELVSPILIGGEGLNKCYHVISNGLGSLSTIKVNKSMGFHVHVDVSDIPLRSLKNICQNFIKYEDAIDSFLPPSRRTGSANRYCKSNKLAISGSLSNKSRHNRIEGCTSMQDLFEVMNPGKDRYYKLNFQNLVTGRQPTIEFRQHSATSEYPKLKNWVRLCVSFVHNSIRFKSPSPLKDNASIDEQFDKLFYFLIKDRSLRTFYQGRKKELENNEESHECCSSCMDGEGCSRPNKRLRV